VATATGSVPLNDVPVIPTLPVAQVAVTSVPPVAVVYPLARPLSQSMTAFGASDSFIPPIVTHPWLSPVPGDSECTTAKPRGTQVRTCEFEMRARSPRYGAPLPSVRDGGGAPSSCFTGQKMSSFGSVPAK
jgi:hypothetical protein